MAVPLRFREPFVGSIRVFRNTFAHEIQLSQQILRIGVAIVGGPFKIERCCFRILGSMNAAKIFPAQPVGGEIVAIVRRAFQPVDTLGGIVNVGIVGEIQLAQRILRRIQVLLGSTL